MGLGTFLLTTTAAAGAFMGAKRLIADESLIERLPGLAQAPATRLRHKLLSVRELLAEGFREGRAARDAAERELTDEYHRRSHR